VKKKIYIPVEDIPEEGVTVFYDDISQLWEGSEYRIEPFSRAEIQLHKTADNDICLDGKITVSTILICDKCLFPFKQDIDAAFSYLLTTKKTGKEPNPLTDEAEFEVKANDDESYLFDGINIPVGDIFMEQFELQLPISKLCKEECKGLCPACGADLNKETCNCKKTAFFTPFEVLKNLKIQEKSKK